MVATLYNLKLNMCTNAVAMDKYSAFKTNYCILDLLTKGFDAGRHVKRGQDTKIPQSSGPPVKVGDEVVHKELGDRIEGATTIASSLEAKQDIGNINRTQSMATLNGSSPLGIVPSRVPVPRIQNEGVDAQTSLKLILIWATAKENTVNSERQLQALVDKKRVIITESSIRSDLHLEDAGGIDCLPTATIFEELERIGAKSTAWNEFSSTMASHSYLGDMSHYKKIYGNPSHTKKIFSNMKREGKDFYGRVTPLFATMMVQATQDKGVDSGIPTDSQLTPITTQPSSSRP
ncbi:hypothetical protein Tco_1093607 [Tanacetum coccineum]|uniref:Uncharacterized protein n=1 Tax=Tanacetum coccineum TaxID=301880 RepID=A0ABQ5IEG6_9ASTR